MHEVEVVLIDGAEPAVRPDTEALLARVRAIQDGMARLPVLDERSPEEIIGYNGRGHFD